MQAKKDVSALSKNLLATPTKANKTTAASKSKAKASSKAAKPAMIKATKAVSKKTQRSTSKKENTPNSKIAFKVVKNVAPTTAKAKTPSDPYSKPRPMSKPNKADSIAKTAAVPMSPLPSSDARFNSSPESNIIVGSVTEYEKSRSSSLSSNNSECSIPASRLPRGMDGLIHLS
ncbi:hypothetical protein LTS18_009234 [Coniosporium uncinatum]|uniref:Uncharacterized protein n=1 Tax=Coniosporium uncinatum TaxID=93489 RepID=A0ACC3DMG3_9PEZI|nr:hypothetical protein LTS18_009234 [Coniosporium uncinatum]